jgi:hypothetical protein
MHPALLPVLALIPLWNGMVTVQSGVSDGGAHWRMAARTDRQGLLVTMSVRDYDGWGMGAKVSARDPLMADAADDIGDKSERLIDGAVYKTVATVRVETAKRTFVIHPRAAPAKTVRSYRGLKDFRFFVHWFAEDDTPRKVSALDRDGKVLAEQAVGNGAVANVNGGR